MARLSHYHRPEPAQLEQRAEPRLMLSIVRASVRGHGKAPIDAALREHQRLFQADSGAPSINALVSYDNDPERSSAFWGPSPPEPREARENVWATLVGAIYDYDWPPMLPSEMHA